MLANNHGEVPRVHMDMSTPREESNAAIWSSRLTGALRARGDQFLVLLALLAIWQMLSMTFGNYWIGSPWGVLTRFAAGIAGGDLLRHASYTLSEAALGFLIGALPAIALPFCLRRFP
ncbi:MAG: sulfonate transport system permease protein, partial [Hyphomicrobiales bacterium]